MYVYVLKSNPSHLGRCSRMNVEVVEMSMMDIPYSFAALLDRVLLKIFLFSKQYWTGKKNYLFYYFFTFNVNFLLIDFDICLLTFDTNFLYICFNYSKRFKEILKWQLTSLYLDIFFFCSEYIEGFFRCQQELIFMSLLILSN